ncbi:MAG: glycosyltransferase [bacterium]
MKKILHISKYYSPYVGGIESTCKYIVDYMQTDYINKVICFNNNNQNCVDIIDGVEVTRVGVLGTVSSQAISPSMILELRSLLNNYKPDLIHFHAPNPLVAAVLLMFIDKKTKLVVHWHSDVIGKLMYRLIKPVETALLNRADKIFATSPNYIVDSQQLTKFKEKVEVVASAIEVEKYDLTTEEVEKVAEVRQRYEELPIVFFIGRHVEYKGIEYLLKAEKAVTYNAVFLIAGTGPLTENLKNTYKSERVKFLGRLSDDDLKYHFYAADIFAFPSITKNEAFGLTLAEAMYCNTVPVTFQIKGSGVNWVSINQQTGIECNNRDVNEYGQAIEKLLADSDLLLKYKQNAKQRVVENFTYDIVGEQIKFIYKSMLM